MKHSPLASLLSCAALLAQDPAPTLVVRGGRLFDPAALAAHPLGQLWIAGDKVLGERPADTAIPAGVPVLDAKGCTVLPGLFDLHAHIAVHGGGYSLAARIAPEENLETALLCGVTNVVDLHGDPALVFPLRERSRRDPALARLWCAGGAFTVPKGHATQFDIPANEITEVADVDKCFAALMPHKPDVIKLILEHGQWGGLPAMPTLDDELARAVVAAAHGQHLRAWSHVWSLPEAKTAVAAGVDVLAHGVFLGEVDGELLLAMRKAGTAYVPTLAVVLASAHALQKKPPFAHALAREVLHPELYAYLNDPDPGPALAASPMARFAKTQEPLFLGNLKAVAAAGLPVGLGTDAGNPFVPHGPGVLFELELYVAAGLSPSQALRAATLGSATTLGIADRAGSLAAGKDADLVLVHGDPTAKIDDVWEVADVVKAGRRVDRAAARARNALRGKPPEVIAIADAAAQPAFGFGGAFETSTDRVAPGGKSSCELLPADGSALRFRGEIKAGFAYGPWAGASMLFHPERRRLVDASALHGIRLELRGTDRPLTLTVHCAAVKDFNIFTATLHPKAGTQTIDVPFADLRQIGYGRKVEWTAKDITGIALEYRCVPFAKVEEGAVELEVASIRFY